MDRVLVVGIGEDGLAGLGSEARQAIESADLLIGTGRLLAMVPTGHAERRAANPGTEESLRLAEVAVGSRRVVVLASGDPGFFGVGKLYFRRLGRERVGIVPHVSSVQLAFARIGESWEDAALLSVHGRSLQGLVPAVRRSGKVAILTDERNSPPAIARELLAAGVDGYRAHLCENLGGREERVTEMGLAELADAETAPLSVLVLIRDATAGPREAGAAWRHGIPDEEFEQRRPRRGLITKLEVRMAVLGLLQLREDSTVWDVGAGSGSVAIEAGFVARAGTVYAVERDTESVGIVRRNVAQFGATNVEVIEGAAPEALVSLPGPDAVFVGGSGGRLAEILGTALARLRPGGRIVVGAASIETVGLAARTLREHGLDAAVTMIQASRSKDLAGLTHLEALNPVFLISTQFSKREAST
ncbi:MAG TPA: precorrin-6y C5,15-methyltransferase (decarboxylating) subunit CbiE [Chloroflexota bacterium]